MELSINYDHFLKNIGTFVFTEELYEFIDIEELLNYVNCIYKILREEEDSIEDQ